MWRYGDFTPLILGLFPPLVDPMASYEALKASVDKNGEVMVRLDTGEKIELHKH